MTAARWFKKDLKFLRSQIDHFVLFHGLYRKPEAIRRVIEARRSEIVISGARSFCNMLIERAREYRETVEHARTTGVHGTATAEIVERFTVLADETERDVARLGKLIERLETEGVPEAVATYMPERLKGVEP